jgi:hypothetical protein
MAKISKMQKGGALGMKSVKAGFDKNPGVTRADIIVAAKKEAKDGKKVKKAQFGGLFGRKQEKVGSREARKEMRKTQKMGRAKSKVTGCGPMGGAKYKSGGTLKKARNGSTLTPSKTSTSNRLASYGRPLGKNLKKAQMGTTTPSQMRSRTAASIGRQASAMRKARTAARPMMKMGGKCRGGCY